MSEHYATKLKQDYEHCLTRMMDLFAYGRKREYILETAVANAEKYFSQMAGRVEDKELSCECKKLADFMLESLLKKPDLGSSYPPKPDNFTTITEER